MEVDKGALLEMYQQLSVEDKRKVRRYIIPRGRPKRTEQLVHISARVSVERAKLLRKLAAERDISVAQLCTQLITLGLPALTGKHVHELLETSSNGHVTVT
jgi:hypothetical protein